MYVNGGVPINGAAQESDTTTSATLEVKDCGGPGGTHGPTLPIVNWDSADGELNAPDGPTAMTRQKYVPTGSEPDALVMLPTEPLNRFDAPEAVPT
jgi:hypothetical protein